MSQVPQNVQRLCDEFEIRIVPKSTFPMPGETRAVATLDRIGRKFGEGHLRLLLSTLMETKGNHGLIDEVSLWAVSDLILSCPQWVEHRTTEWLDAWDHLPMGPMMFIVQELRGKVHQRSALAGLIYSWLRAELDPEAGLTERAAPRRMETRLDESEIDKGRKPLRPAFERSTFEKVALGRALLEAKARLPYRGFQDWVRHEAGLAPSMAQMCMRAARAAAGANVEEIF